MAFRILVVCTANICRSPLAERLLRARLRPSPTPAGSVRSKIVVESAGVAGLDGHAMDGASARALLELGGDPSGHVARSLTLAAVADADLILTAATVHRTSILEADPLAFRRTFTLREFARLGRDLDDITHPSSASDALLGRVAAVARQRGLAESPEPGGDEIADPFGAPWREVQAAARQISDAVDGTLSALGLVAVRASGCAS